MFEKSASGGEDKFVAGVIIDTMDGPLFIEGRLIRDGEKDTIFAPGHTDQDGSFHPAAGPTGMSMRRTPEPGDSVDGANLAISINKKTKPKNGRMVKPKDGSGPGRFYADGEEIPPEVLAVSEVIPGRMEWGENGPAFVPGTSMELNGIRSFIPGKVIMNADGSQSFVPGKVINTKNGPKFVCGQVIQTEEGEKFLPGIVMEKEGQGKVFVPAMEMQTKTGPMLIPGQVRVAV